MRGLVVVACLLLGCRTVGTPATSELTVKTLEVTFASEPRGQFDLGLEVRGGGFVTRAQWELRLDGRPLGSGVQLLSQRLPDVGSTLIALSVPLPLPHTSQDEGWRTVTLEVSGELTVERRLEERLPFALRKQALVRGAPIP